MTILWINHETTARLVDALCKTLIHSLWQGILLAFIAGITVIVTRRSRATLRYNLLVSAFMLFALGVFATFIWQYQSTAGVTNTPYVAQGPVHFEKNVTPVITQAVAQTPAKPLSAVDRVSGFLNDHHNTIALVWFLIICARTLQFGFGLYGTHRLKHVGVVKVENKWQDSLRQLAGALRIKQTIRLLESSIAKVPMVFGHFKPVILVPIGLLTALSAGEVEAILVHELAHIKRRDYLVNMLQCMVEILFFFNPALMWVSKLIKTERENCCDDLALAQNNNKLNYIRALVSCQEYQANMPMYALSFSSSRNTLLRRVQRMVGNYNYSLNLLEKTVLAVCMVALGVGVSAFSGKDHNENNVNEKRAAIPADSRKQVTQNLNPITSGIIQSKHSAPTAVSNHNFNEMHAVNDTLPVTAKPHTSQLLYGDSSVMNLSLPIDPHAYNVMHDVGVELYHEGLVIDTNHLNISLNDRELIVNSVKMSDQVHDRIYRQFDNKTGSGDAGNRSYIRENKAEDNYTSPDRDDREKNARIGDDLVRNKLVKDKKNYTYRLSKDGLYVDGVKQSDELYRRITTEYFKPDDRLSLTYSYSDPGNPSETHDHSDAVGYGTSGTIHQQSSDAVGHGTSGTIYQQSRDAVGYGTSGTIYQKSSEARQTYWAEQQKRLIIDLLHDGLITDPKNVSFSISNENMIINGQKQSAEVYKKYKGKYMADSTGTGWSWSYSHHE